MPIVDNPTLYEKAKKIADKKYAKPSAYKSGYIVKTYKEMGGTYTDDGKPKNLKRWYKERWSDVGGLDYPVLRPTVKVSKKTPLLPSEISNLTEQIKLKQKIKGKNLPPFISQGISMKGKKGRMYGGMDKLPKETLDEISGFLRQPPTEERPETTPSRLAVESGMPEERNRGLIDNLKEEFSEIYEHPMNARGMRKYRAFLQSQEESELKLAKKRRVDQRIAIRLFLQRNPDGFNPDACVASGKKGGMMRRRLEDELQAQEQLPEPSRERRPIYTRKQATDFENKKVPVPPEITNIAGLLHNVLPELVHTIYISTSLHSIGWTEEDIFFLAGNDIPAFKRLIIHLSKNPSEYLKSVGSGKKGGMPRKDKDIILPPPAVARAVTGEATRPFLGQEVYADFPEAPSVFSDFTLAEEQREIARAEQRDQANIDSLFRQYGQMYPGGLSAQGSASDYSDFTNRYLPSRRMNESYVANLPVAERGRIISAFLRQRQGMCVASGKPKRSSKWIEHVKAHAKKHGVSYKQAMQDSRRTYGGGPSQSKSSKAERHPDEVYTPRSTRGLDTIVERLPQRTREAVVSKKLADIQHAQDLQRATRTPLPVSQPHQQVARALRAEQYPTFHYTDAVAVPLNTPPIKPTLKMPEYRERDVSAVDTRRAEKLTQMPDNVELKILQLASNMMTKSPYFDPRKHSMELFHEFMLRNYKRSIKGWYNSDATARKAMMHYYLTGSRNYV